MSRKSQAPKKCRRHLQEISGKSNSLNAFQLLWECLAATCINVSNSLQLETPARPGCSSNLGPSQCIIILRACMCVEAVYVERCKETRSHAKSTQMLQTNRKHTSGLTGKLSCLKADYDCALMLKTQEFFSLEFRQCQVFQTKFQ